MERRQWSCSKLRHLPHLAQCSVPQLTAGAGCVGQARLEDRTEGAHRCAVGGSDGECGQRHLLDRAVQGGLCAPGNCPCIRGKHCIHHRALRFTSRPICLDAPLMSSSHLHNRFCHHAPIATRCPGAGAAGAAQQRRGAAGLQRSCRHEPGRCRTPRPEGTLPVHTHQAGIPVALTVRTQQATIKILEAAKLQSWLLPITSSPRLGGDYKFA